MLVRSHENNKKKEYTLRISSYFFSLWLNEQNGADPHGFGMREEK